MGRYGEIIDEGTHEYRGLTYTWEIYQDDDAESPLKYMDSPGIWIHDNATRNFGDLALVGSIWEAMEDFDKYPNGVEDAYLAWANRRYDELVKEYSPRLVLGEKLTDDRVAQIDGVRTRAKAQARHKAYGLHSIVEFFERETSGIAMMLYGFDHSGRSVSTSDFNDRWDSGAIGIVYMTPAMIRKRMLWKRITKARRAEMTQYMRDDIEAIDNWLHGYVYGYVFYDEKGDEPTWNSCWGHHDDWQASYTKQSAIEAIEGHIDGIYLDIEVARVKRFVNDTGFWLGKLRLAGEGHEWAINRRMARMQACVNRLPAWRRKDALDGFDSAYEAAITHPFMGMPGPYLAAWDANVTTSYGGIG